jgi:hypothetical protein
VEARWPHGRHALGAAKRATDGGRPLIRVPRRPTAQRGGLDGLVPLVVGIALWAVWEQEEQPQPIAVAPAPPRGDGRGLPGMPSYEQQDGLPHWPEPATAEWQDAPRGDARPEPQEGQPVTIGDGRAPVAATAPAGAADHRGLAALAPPGACLLGCAQPHLVAPVERGPRARGRCPKPGDSTASQRCTAVGSRSAARHRGFCGVKPPARRARPTVPPDTRRPSRRALRSPTASRVPKEPGKGLGAGPQGGRSGRAGPLARP